MRSLKNKPLYNHLTTASRYVVKSQRTLYLFGWSVHSGQFSLWHWSTNAVLLLQISWELWNKKAQQDRNVPQCPLKLQGKSYPPSQKQRAQNPSYHLHSFSFNFDILYLDTSFIECLLTWVSISYVKGNVSHQDASVKIGEKLLCLLSSWNV